MGDRINSSPHARKLRPFQLEDVKTLRRANYRALIANSPGTGKTIEVLACIEMEKSKLLPAIVICPASVTLNWAREANTWCPWAKVHVISDSSSHLEPAHIYITSWSLLAPRIRSLRGLRPRLVVADECHFAKCEETKRSQALRALASSAPHILLLSGTPLINCTEELDVMLSFVGGQHPVMIRRLLSDVAKDVPPKTRSMLHIELRSSDRAEYRRAESDFEHWLEVEIRRRRSDGEAEAAVMRALAAEALVKIGYLRRLVGEAKVHAAADWIGRAVRVGEPVVVFAEHREPVKKLKKLLRKQGLRFVLVDGSTSPKDRLRNIDRFQRGEIPIFLGSKAAATGITLTRSRNTLFVERFLTSAEEEQAEDRTRRIGQRFPTTMWFLHAVNTLDDRLSEIIETKRGIIHSAIGNTTIEETDQQAITRLISTWTRYAGTNQQETTSSLGLGKLPPPLPSPNEVCLILFRRRRWNEATAIMWARMFAYHPTEVATSGSVVRLTNHPPMRFKPGTFKTINVTKDIQCVVGERSKKHSRSTRKSQRDSQKQQAR